MRPAYVGSVTTDTPNIALTRRWLTGFVLGLELDL